MGSAVSTQASKDSLRAVEKQFFIDDHSFYIDENFQECDVNSMNLIEDHIYHMQETARKSLDGPMTQSAFSDLALCLPLEDISCENPYANSNKPLDRCKP